MMVPEREPQDESYKAWLYMGYYVAKIARKTGELGARACKAIARASAESDPEWRPNLQARESLQDRMRERDDCREFTAQVENDIAVLTEEGLTLDGLKQLMRDSRPHHHEQA